MSGIRAVTFDAGGTLIEPWPSVGAVYSEVAASFGVDCTPAELNARFAEAWRVKQSFAYTREEWWEIVRQSFSDSCEVSPAMFQAIYERFTEKRSWLIYDDVIPALEQIAGDGLKLAVISNWDERLIPLLQTLGLSGYFSEIVVSATLGAHKPNEQIFRHALQRLGVRPEHALHVGDSDREDVQGARSVGMTSFRIRRSGAVEGHDIERLTQVVEAIRRK